MTLFLLNSLNKHQTLEVGSSQDYLVNTVPDTVIQPNYHKISQNLTNDDLTHAVIIKDSLRDSLERMETIYGSNYIC